MKRGVVFRILFFCVGSNDINYQLYHFCKHINGFFVNTIYDAVVGKSDFEIIANGNCDLFELTRYRKSFHPRIYII